MTLKKTFKASILLISIVYLTACSNEPDPFENHLGYWLSYTDFGAIEVMGSNGDYQFRYIKTDRLGVSSEPKDLIVSDKRLFWHPRGETPHELELIDGTLRLRFDRNTWDRSTKEEIDTIKANNKIN